jgi:cell division protein FtsQ
MSLDQTLSRSRGRRRAVRPVRLRRAHLRLLVAIVALAALVGGGWLWLRDSSLVRVREVQVTGTTSSAEPRIRAALEGAGRAMTTLHVRDAALQRAVAGFPSVAALRVRTEFPHRLMVEVIERDPVAVLASGSQSVAATSGGLLLHDVTAPKDLPAIALDVPLSGERAAGRTVLSALAVAAAAPKALRERTTRISWGPRGLTAELRDGPPLYFGSRDDAASKWAAAARVLADPGAAGATYLDLRVTGRVAAGGLGPVVADETSVAPQNGAVPTPAPTITPDPQP